MSEHTDGIRRKGFGPIAIELDEQGAPKPYHGPFVPCSTETITPSSSGQQVKYVTPGFPEQEPLFKVKLLHPKAKVPTKAYGDEDLGWDVYAVGPYTLWHGHITLIQTGIAIQPRKGWGYISRERGSQALAQVFTHGGVFDQGFTGEVQIGLTCETPQYYINEGDKIAQLIFIEIAKGGPVVVEEFEPTVRGERKHGSSGK